MTKQLYTVNRLFQKGRATRRIVLSQSNQGNSEKEARKYGRLIEKKEVLGGVWVFAGIIYSDVENASKVTQNWGKDDTDVLRLTGIDVTEMGIFANV